MLCFKKYEFLIAWRYLMSKRRQGGISIIAWYALIGVVIGVATLIIVQAVMIGFRQEFVEKIVGANSHLSIYKTNTLDNHSKLFSQAESDGIINTLEKKDNFRAAYPLIKGQVLSNYQGKNLGVEVLGLEYTNLLKSELLKYPIYHQGDIKNFKDGVALGSQLARKLGVAVGDELKLISPDGAVSVFGTIPRVNIFTVVYIFSVGRYDIDSTRIYMPIRTAQEFFNKENKADMIEVLINNPFSVERFKESIREISQDNYIIWSWKDRTAAFLDALDLERRVMFLILSLIILIAAMNIISGMVMLVKNKGRDIGILRSMGLTKNSILRIFFICGSLIGIIGTVFGMIIGVLFVNYISEIQSVVEYFAGSSVWNPELRFLTQVPAVLRLEDTIFVIIVSLSISFVITYFPARKAANLDPVDALKYE
tara:strand:- start:589 stop:1860 length:1272 start_codon:yes stop_codon:yes gene_type:complete